MDMTIGCEKSGFGVRHGQVALSYFGLINYGFNSFSLSIALVGMTDTTLSSGPVLDYTLFNKGFILGMFPFGIMLGMIPSGYLISNYDPMRLMSTVSGIGTGVLQVFFPLAAVHCGFTSACILRVLVGITQAVGSSGPYAHLSRWVARQEQDKFSFVWGGSGVGIVAVLALSGILVPYGGGWPSIFYVSGVLSSVWGIIGLFWGYESPGSHPTISSVEKDFLKNITTIEGKARIKWKAMFTSVPIWALMIVHSCSHWTAVTISSLLPTFFHKTTNIPVELIGYSTAGIYLCQIGAGIGFSFLANKLMRHVSTNFSRKFWNTIAMCGGAIPLFLLYTVTDETVPEIIMITVYYMLIIGVLPGHMTNNLELAPSHSGMIASVMLFTSNLIAFTGPILAGVIVRNVRDPGEWWHVFALGASLDVIGAVVFLIFGSSEVQPWNDD